MYQYLAYSKNIMKIQIAFELFKIRLFYLLLANNIVHLLTQKLTILHTFVS